MFEILFPTGYIAENKSVGNIDVVVKMHSGDSYAGTIFSLENIIYLSSLPENKDYFWASDMVIVTNLEYETIYTCVKKMIHDNVLYAAFEKIT